MEPPTPVRYLAPMAADLILVHHPEVEARWRGLCFGRSEAQLSDLGQAGVPRLVDELVAFNPVAVMTSPLARACAVSKPLAERLGQALRLDPRLNDREYGVWEGQSWQQIQAQDRDGMREFMANPEHFAPPAGETLAAVAERMITWFRQLPTEDPIVAVSHATPIAALLGTLNGTPAEDWQDLLPAAGERTRLALGT